jgi:hypothetical protein
MTLIANTCYGFELPPVRVNGNVNTSYGTSTSSGGEVKSTSQTISTNIDARSYIWRPWFALINGGITLSTNKYESAGISDESDFIGENLQIGFFPKSHFPFTIYGSKTLYKPGDSLTVNDTVTTSFGMRQSYSTRQGTNYNFRYDRRLYDAGEFSLNETNIFEGMVSKSLGFNRFNGLMNISKLEDKVRDNQSVDYVVTGRHSYVGSKNLNLETLASSTSFNDDIENIETEDRTNQLSTFLSWRPDGSRKLNLAGSVRIAGKSREREEEDVISGTVINSSNDTKTLNLSQSLSYIYSPRVTFSETATGTVIEINNESRFNGSETFNINYSDEAIKTRFGIYNRGAGASISNQHGEEPPEQILSASLSHSIRDKLVFFDDVNVDASVSQSVSGSAHTEEEEKGKIKHSLRLKWFDKPEKQSTTPKTSVVEFSFGDDRSLNEVSVFQIYNLQASSNSKLSVYSQLNGHITLQRIVNKTEQNKSSSTTLNGQISYTNNRLFDVYRLKYDSAIKFSEQRSKIESRIASVNPEDKPSDLSWTNKITHRIGLLSTRYNFDVTKNENKYDYSMRIQLTRSF